RLGGVDDGRATTSTATGSAVHGRIDVAAGTPVLTAAAREPAAPRGLPRRVASTPADLDHERIPRIDRGGEADLTAEPTRRGVQAVARRPVPAGAAPTGELHLMHSRRDGEVLGRVREPVARRVRVERLGPTGGRDDH